MNQKNQKLDGNCNSWHLLPQCDLISLTSRMLPLRIRTWHSRTLRSTRTFGIGCMLRLFLIRFGAATLHSSRAAPCWTICSFPLPYISTQFHERMLYTVVGAAHIGTISDSKTVLLSRMLSTKPQPVSWIPLKFSAHTNSIFRSETERDFCSNNTASRSDPISSVYTFLPNWFKQFSEDFTLMTGELHWKSTVSSAYFSTPGSRLVKRIAA